VLLRKAQKNLRCRRYPLKEGLRAGKPAYFLYKKNAAPEPLAPLGKGV